MMRFVLSGFVALAFVVLGCSKSAPSGSEKSTDASAPAAKIHWLGKKRLATDKSATNLLAIWNMPESAKLEAQTLDRFATAPWRLLKSATPLSNAPVALLRPLLDDLVREESYLEVRAAPQQPGELVLAIRLDAARAGLWQKNLAAVLESLTGVRSTTKDFSLQTSDFRLQLTRSGDWTLVAMTAGTGSRDSDSRLLADFTARIQRNHVPFPASTTNYWLTAEADPRRVSDAFSLGWRWPDHLSEFNLALLGDGQNVRTLGALVLSQPAKVPLEPWHIPTNLIAKSVTSFTAVRGLAPELKNSKWFGELQVGPPPNQLFVWSLPSFPMETVVSFPLARNDNRYALVQQRLLSAGNQWIATNSTGKFVPAEGSPGVIWQGAPFMTPFVRPMRSGADDFLCLGLVPTPLTNAVGHVDLAGRVWARTNAVYYDWEFTGPRIESWFYMGQLFRVIFGRGQLPSDSAVTAWLKALQPKLSNSGTVITLTGPSQLSLERSSTIGLTAFELHALADWIESPEFPRGLHTALVATKRKLSPAAGGAPGPRPKR
jgi:hypothetical protein